MDDSTSTVMQSPNSGDNGGRSNSGQSCIDQGYGSITQGGTSIGMTTTDVNIDDKITPGMLPDTMPDSGIEQGMVDRSISHSPLKLNDFDEGQRVVKSFGPGPSEFIKLELEKLKQEKLQQEELTKDATTKKDKEKVKDRSDETRPRLVILDKTGEGNVLFCRVDMERERVYMGSKQDVEFWRQISRIRDYSVAVLDNKLYLTGGFHIDDRKYLGNVFRLDLFLYLWSFPLSL